MAQARLRGAQAQQRALVPPARPALRPRTCASSRCIAAGSRTTCVITLLNDQRHHAQASSNTSLSSISRTREVEVLVQRGDGLNRVLPLHRLSMRQQDRPARSGSRK